MIEDKKDESNVPAYLKFCTLKKSDILDKVGLLEVMCKEGNICSNIFPLLAQVPRLGSRCLVST